ncbi:UNVERIFIED_CONTAM: hypothetical protein RKD43_006036 [Streptomyces graminofaciens]
MGWCQGRVCGAAVACLAAGQDPLSPPPSPERRPLAGPVPLGVLGALDANEPPVAPVAPVTPVTPATPVRPATPATPAVPDRAAGRPDASRPDGAAGPHD